MPSRLPAAARRFTRRDLAASAPTGRTLRSGRAPSDRGDWELQAGVIRECVGGKEGIGQPHRGHAGAAGLGGQERGRVQTLDGQRLRGVQNPLFFRDNAAMLFGDAKTTVDDVVNALAAVRV